MMSFNFVVLLPFIAAMFYGLGYVLLEKVMGVNINPALAETSYPLFTVAFGFFIFGIKKLDLITFGGGLLVLIGAAIMIYGQSAGQSNE